MTSPAENTKKPMSMSLKAALITIPAVIAIFVAFFFFSGNGRAGEAAPSSTGSAATTPLVLPDSHYLDSVDPDAPVLVEFLDFECEACGALYPTMEEIRAEYDGKINYVVRYFPIPGHKNSMTSALAVEAAAQQGEFEAMYQKMFETQGSWGEKQDSQADVFRGYAEDLGLDMAKYDKTIADPATQARIEKDFNAGQTIGITGTPTLFLEGKLLSPQSVTDITDALDAAIAARQ